MKILWRRLGGVLWAATVSLAVAGVSAAETIELVTYYPATVSGGPAEFDRLHAGRATVGNPYDSTTNPADADLPNGTLLVAGLVGIGTATPQRDLEVYREDESTMRIWGTGINATPENFAALELGSDLPADGVVDRIWQIAHKRGGAGGLNDFHINYFDGAAGSTRLAILPSGNVGIGVTNPTTQLELPQFSTIRLGGAYVSSGVGSGGEDLAHFASNCWWDGTQWVVPNPGRRSSVLQLQNERFVFWQSVVPGGALATPRLVIDGDGRVGIGTTGVPSARLTVQGSSGDGAGGLRLRDPSNNFRSLYMTNNDTTLGFINQGGNLATLSNTGAWTNASDRVYKKEIADIRYGLREVLQLKPRQYRMEADNTPQVGFVAQEVRDLIPEVVYGDEPNLNLSYDQMLPVVVKAVQELKAENEGLKRQLADDRGEFSRRLSLLERVGKKGSSGAP